MTTYNGYGQLLEENGNSYFQVDTETIPTTYEDMFESLGISIVNVTSTQYNNGMTYGLVTSAKISLLAGTYYLYSIYKTTSGVPPKFYTESDTGAFTDVTSTIATITNKSGFGNGTYNEYHAENTPYYQPNGAGYFVECTFELSENFEGYIHFGASSQCYAKTEVGYTHLFDKAYNPYKDSLVDITTKSVFIQDEYENGFVEELLKNEVFAKVMQYALPNSYGKTWYHIGDSNSQWMGGTVLADENNTGFLLTACRKNGISKLTNASMAGASWAYRVDYEDGLNNQCGIARVDDLVASGEVPNIITILLGTNSDDEIGTVDNTKDDTYTTCGAIRYCLEKLLVAFPKSAIGVMLPMQRAETWKHQEEKNKLIKELCEYYSIPVLDLFHEGQVVPDSKLTAYDDGHTGVVYTDSAHISTNGIEQLGRKISEFINRI